MQPYRKLLIASAKGGVGKSTTALGIASALTENRADSGVGRTLLCDLDVTSRSLDLLLGAESLTTADFTDVLYSPAASAAVHPIESRPGLSFIKASTYDRLCTVAERESAESPEELAARAVRLIMADESFDCFVFDTGGECEIPYEIAADVDMAIVTSEQSATSIRAAEYAAERLIRSGCRKVRLVICGFDLTAVKRERRAGIIEMIDRCSLPCLGVVPFDKTLARAQDRGTLPGDRALSTIAYRNIAARLLGEEIPLFYGMGRLYRRRSLAF